ncbi:unnamed protein product [Cylindrotheca closterium]|uniref:Calmodulin n=1 Tax=Cylindrotheca closterium TaxID=2856 RepID=A0AAD2G947_9STRA|nr:unnamed protein product [Cylindrotheca closterium]
MRCVSIFLLSLGPGLVQCQGSQNQDAPIQSGPTTNQDRVVDYPYCYEALNRHDSDLNKRITKSEYRGFCQDFGGNTECLANLDELPIELQAVWNEITCECAQRGGAGDCCVGSNAHIPINGVLPTDTTTISQQQFLRQACLRTDQAIIAYCGPPPIPPVIGPPGGLVLVPPAAFSVPGQWGIIAAAIILLLCCCRRRWFFFPDKQEDDSSSESSSVDGGSAAHNVVEDAEAGAMDNADAAKKSSKAKSTEEANLGGTTTFGRTVQEPEYEDDEEYRKTKYEQYDRPNDPGDPFNLRPTDKPPPPPQGEDPYSLEHYTPDGGVVQYERTGEWSYDADGGYVPETRPDKEKTERKPKKYQRAEKKAPEVVDNRKKRTLEAYGGGDIFNQLDGEVSDAKGGGDGMFDWVIRETLNTLDDNALHLDESTDEE